MAELGEEFQVHLGRPAACGLVEADHLPQSGASNMVFLALGVRLAVPPGVDRPRHSCACDVRTRPVTRVVVDMHQVLLERLPPVPLPFAPVPCRAVNREDNRHSPGLSSPGDALLLDQRETSLDADQERLRGGWVSPVSEWADSASLYCSDGVLTEVSVVVAVGDFAEWGSFVVVLF